jgi:hypothetical protein
LDDGALNDGALNDGVGRAVAASGGAPKPSVPLVNGTGSPLRQTNSPQLRARGRSRGRPWTSRVRRGPFHRLACGSSSHRRFRGARTVLLLGGHGVTEASQALGKGPPGWLQGCGQADSETGCTYTKV